MKRKRVAKDFNAEEVIRLVGDEEFSAWCERDLSDDSPDEEYDEGDESQRRGGHVADNISYFQLIHNFPLS